MGSKPRAGVMSAVYLNHAGTSWPKPSEVQAAVAEVWTETPTEAAAALDRRHRSLAESMHVDPEHLLLTPGCTSALHLALADFDWRPGDVLVLGAFEHLAIERPARALEARGVELRVAPPGSDGTVDLEVLKGWLTSASVRMVALSAAANVTGVLMPWREVRAMAHRYGAVCLLDAAQTVGWVDLDLRETDLCAFGSHKGLQGPWGLGGLYVRPGVPMVSPRAGAPVPGPSWCDAGSVDRAALAGVEAGWRYLRARPRRLERARAHIGALEAAVASHSQLERLETHAAADRMPSLAFVGPAPSSVLASRLAQAGVVAGAGQQCAPLAHSTLGTGSAGCLRFSVGPQTTDDEVETAIEAILGGVLEI